MASIPPKVQDGARELAKRDPVLKRMLKEHGVPELHRARPNRTHFAELARMICYQQLAGRAASVIHGRFAALFDGPPTPEAVLALSMEELRCGRPVGEQGRVDHRPRREGRRRGWSSSTA